MKTRIIKPKRMSEMYNSPMSPADKIYPQLTLSFTDLPEAKDWEVGEIYEIEMTVKQVRTNEDENGGTVTFEIRKVAIDEDDIEEGDEGE